MVYPFDMVTAAELSDHAITPNGFKLDMAKSRYLTIDVTQTVLMISADGHLAEDVSFNCPAKDSDSYTDEGIYTFTIKIFMLVNRLTRRFMLEQINIFWYLPKTRLLLKI